MVCKVNFKTYDVTIWITNNYNTHIAQYLTKWRNQTMKFALLIEYNKTNIFLQKSCRKWRRETSSRSLFVFLENGISFEESPLNMMKNVSYFVLKALFVHRIFKFLFSTKLISSERLISLIDLQGYSCNWSIISIIDI